MRSCRAKFFSYAILLALVCLSNGVPRSAAQQPLLARTPPMGWNSWDAYGTTIDEANFKANVDWFAKHLKPFGWQYVVVDMEWFVTNPIAEGNSKTFQYSMDRYGRYMPPPTRFPSAARDLGFKPLADYVHALGLKFGIHILRGIPREAVHGNLPIEGSNYRAADAADTSDTCPWNFDNFGINAKNPAGAAYYDSIARLYASWKVDLIKVDCISSRPYKGDEIRLLREALDKTGRPIVLSLSPGPAPLEKTAEMRRYAQMWRISDDIWDLWHSTVDYPQGLGDQFANVAKWAGVAEPGHWPDVDMLPLGYLGPAPGWGKPRQTQLSHDEQRTLVTLWSIFGSPLMVGGDLKSDDDWTAALLTNPEVIEVDQHSTESRPVVTTDTAVIWKALPASGSGVCLAVFNIAPTSKKIHYDWKLLSLASPEYTVRDLWERRDIGTAKSLDLTLPPHACVLYRLTPSSTSPQAQSSSNAIDFDDRPNFAVAGITDVTASGGHASETRIRTGEKLAKETVNLAREPAEIPITSAEDKQAGTLEAELRAALKESPLGFQENFVLGDFYFHRHECREAIPFLQTAHTAKLADHSSNIDLALALKDCGELAQARDQVNQMLASDKDLGRPQAADLHRILGDLDESLEDPLAAEREYELAARLDASEKNYFSWGTELFLHRAAAPAVDVFSKGARLHPESARMLVGWGAALYETGAAEEAAKRLCDASDLDPANPAPYLFLGKMQESASVSLPCAEEKLARFAQNQPANAQANYYYALALWRRDRGSENPAALARIEALLQKAAAIDPHFDLANLQLGNIYFAQGALPEALFAYQKAAEANPANSDAHYRLGLAYKRLGQEANAEREFQEYKRLDRTETEKIERQRHEARQFLFVLEDQAQP